MIDLSYKNNSEKYLVSEDGYAIYAKSSNSAYDILEKNGFDICDLSYRKHVNISKKDLLKHFAFSPEKVMLSYASDSFSTFSNFWYNKEHDFYIKIANTIDDEAQDDMFDDEDIIIEDSESYRVMTIWYKTETIKKVQKLLNDTCIFNPSTDNKIHLVIQTNTGFEFRDFKLNVPTVDIKTMYNDDFEPVYEHMVDKLNNGNKGVVLLYGTMGSGKTNLIKSLTSQVKKGFIFIPIGMIDVLASPTFIEELIKHKGSVLVIEDCENYIEDRKINKSSVVSTILQITDGMLSDVLDIKVICTFNTDLTQIDPALLREGRLITEYEFKELSAEKTKVLSDGKLTEPSTLATIFNTLTLKTKKKQTTKIGFGR